MKKKSEPRTQIITMVLISLLLSGCSPNDLQMPAREAIIQANNNLEQTSEYRMKIQVQININDVEQNGFFEAEVEKPDLLYLAGDIMGLSLQVYRHKDTYYVRNSITNAWIKSKSLKNFGIKGLLTSFENLDDYIADAIYMPDERSGDISYKVIKCTFDKNIKEKLFTEAVLKKIKDIDYEFKVWIGKDDFLIHQVEIDMVVDSADMGKQKAKVMVDIYDINSQDINITLPFEL